MKFRFLPFALALLATATAALAVLPGKPAKPLHVSAGKEVRLEDFLVPGRTVVFDFYSVHCGPCMAIAPELEQMHARRKDVVVIKVDIDRPGQKGIDWESPVAKQYGLESIPHFKVFGPDGKLKAEDRPGEARGREMVAALIGQ